MIHKEADYGTLKNISVLEFGKGDIAVVASPPDKNGAVHIGFKTLKDSKYSIGQTVSNYKDMGEFEPEVVMIFNNIESLQVIAGAISHCMKHLIENSEFSALPSISKEIKEESSGELINHPKHYNQYPIEVIDMMVSIWGKEKVADFCLLNSFKYRMRAGKKGSPDVDFKKEAWYLKKFNELQTLSSK